MFELLSRAVVLSDTQQNNKNLETIKPVREAELSMFVDQLF